MSSGFQNPITIKDAIEKYIIDSIFFQLFKGSLLGAAIK